jgi:glycosyltransferase involved in cell wall biosynthesis
MDDERGLAHSVERLVELVRRTGPDVLHAHLPNANTVCSLAGAICGVPVLATLHGRQLTQRDAEVLHVGRAHALVVCEAALSHALLLGVPRERVTLVRNGVDLAQFTPAAIASDVPVVGFVGRLSPEKAPLDFVRVAAYVAQRLPRPTFRVVGEGPLLADAQRLAQALGLGERIAFAGLRQDMPAVYRELVLLVSTSVTEGAPYAVLEAMACGVPVVATAVGGVPELVANALTGRVLPAGAIEILGRAVCELLADPQRLAGMARAARERVRERFAVEDQRRATCALLRRLAGRAAVLPVSRPATARK